jgi:glutamate carboxypeptidase
MRLTQEDRRALQGVAEQAHAMVERAVTWCAIPSGSRNLEGLERQRGVLASALSTLPGQVESLPLAPSTEIGADGRIREQPHPDALRLTVRPDAPVQVALTGHYDTVYPAGSTFESVRTRDDGALNGPGIADMKGGLSVMLAALQAVESHPAAGQVGYRVLLSPDEEIGSLASAPHLAELAGRAHIGLTYEPALGDGALAGARKGSGNFSILVRGRAAHAGRDFAQGRNAIAAAARIAARLDSLNALRDDVTINVARIDGGGPSNIVPDTAVVRFNVRAPDAASAAWIRSEIEVAASVGAQAAEVAVEVHGGFTRPPKPFTPVQAELFGAARQAGDLIGQAIVWKASGGVCEGNNLFAAGLPNIDSLGVRGGDIHSESEHAWPESFAERAQLSALILIKAATGDIDARGLRTRMA